MFRKLEKDERREKRDAFRQNPIYRILYTPLWRQRGDDLSPEDVWIEANNFAYELKSIKDTELDFIVLEKFDDLCEHYSCFETIGGKNIMRNHQQAEHSAMMVSLTAFLLLVNTYSEVDNHPYKSTCELLYGVIKDIPGQREIYEEARKIEDEYESKGEFIETADFIEQLSVNELPISQEKIDFANKVLLEMAEENASFYVPTLKDNEAMFSRINDKHNHVFQEPVDKIRELLKSKGCNDDEQISYENIIFDKKYENRVKDIRDAIFPFLQSESPDHIDKELQREWLAIIEPLKQIKGLLIVHEERPRKKQCTDREICGQMKVFFERDVTNNIFDGMPDSISGERKKWNDNKLGLTFGEWKQYIETHRVCDKYYRLAKVAQRVYGEILKAIKR